ncbi:MAG: alpha-L-fucosidase [Clostridia bacterium]|nr:alpha-L-fucosidase [Clostridia bacterium]
MIRTGCIPTKKQLDFMDWEFGAFFHFGIRTFYEGHTDWDMKEMPLSGFAPTDFSAEDWCRTVRDAGAKYAILTAKHHDGFANWPSAYTDYSVKNTPWKDGKGDVVGEFVDACRKYDLKVGLYYSPAQFGSVNMNAEEYDTYFINQIGELLTNYGKIDYLWFDGCGSANHNYDQKRIISAIRGFQPDILIFGMWDPDTTWCGNEAGYSRYPNYYEKDVSSLVCYGREGDSEAGYRFLPDECDCRIRNMWFYGDADKPNLKSLEVLMGIYELSVGRGSNLLLNIGPDRRGRLPEEDKLRLAEFAAEIKRRFAEPMECELVKNGDTFEICIGEDEKEVNCFVIEEDITNGQSVMEFDIAVYYNTENAEIPFALFNGTTIGRKVICSFPAVYARRFTVKIKKHDGDYSIKSITPYKY